MNTNIQCDIILFEIYPKNYSAARERHCHFASVGEPIRQADRQACHVSSIFLETSHSIITNLIELGNIVKRSP